jgi:hypothetical protein
MGAGRALWLAGEGERAAALLESVLGLAAEPAARADLQQLRGLAMLFASPVSKTHAMLVAEADRIDPHDTSRASALLVTAALTCFMAGDLSAPTRWPAVPGQGRTRPTDCNDGPRPYANRPGR